jgi:hypothetical protein
LGYELHITRAEFWAENEERIIGRDEWLRLVEQDPELTIDEQNGPLFANWGPVADGYSPWFDWSEGNVYTKNPDRNTLGKMLQIAALLGATVQGDDGETYTSVDDFPPSVDTGRTIADGSRGDDADLPLPLQRERNRVRLEYIIVGLVVLAWIIFDLARG